MTKLPNLAVGIISWDSMHDAAHRIAEAVHADVDDLVVIYSNIDSATETGPGRWVQAPQDDYFGHKFRTLLDEVQPDNTLLLIQADATCPDWHSLINRYKLVMNMQPTIGLWSPSIDNTAFPNALVAVGEAMNGLINVLQTDAIVLGICPEVVARLASLDYQRNNLGWGIDWVGVGYCQSHSLRVVRDLTQEVGHPRSRGYDSREADAQMDDFLRQLAPVEVEALNAEKEKLQKISLRRNGSSHLGRLILEDICIMKDSFLHSDGGLLDHVSFLVVTSEHVVFSPKHPAEKFSVRRNGAEVLAVPRAETAFIPKMLDFRLRSEEEVNAEFVSGDTWSCPGQSTMRFAFPYHSAQLSVDLIDPLQLEASIGDVQLCLGAAIHRVNADILVAWQDTLDPDRREETWVKLEGQYTGSAEIGDYQAIKVRIPETGGPRLLSIKLFYWNNTRSEPNAGVILCTRPYLISMTAAEAKTSPLVIMSDDTSSGDGVPRYEIRFTASDEEVKLVAGNAEFLLVPAQRHGVQLFEDGCALLARADEYTSQALHVNGRATRMLWVGPEPQSISVNSELMSDPGTLVELRDPTGNVINARFKPVQQETDAPPALSRHPDAWLIDEMFDNEFYSSGFAPDQQPADNVSHYLTEGWQQGRDPTPWFSTWHYLSMHRDVADAGMNPFLHYCLAGNKEGRTLPKLGRQSDGNVYEAHAQAVSPGPYFEHFDPSIGVGRRKRAKILAYYLPQFHATPVNDEHWGAGFTEWRNLPRAIPQFMGHIQPRIPRDLGCYDLAEGDVMRRQIEMAKAAGVYGFCFYHYWFDGKRVLEAPMERLLADPTLDFPFCLMWANENWTRTWDGSEKEVILGQHYREKDDIPFIDDVARHMKDPRYIRIGNRPLLFIYRPGHIPQAPQRLEEWREVFRSRHGLDPLIFNAQAFGDNDPREFHLDGAIEFPPHKILGQAPDISSRIAFFDKDYSGNVRNYGDIVNVASSDPTPEFPLIRTVFPSWDNEARRPGRGTIIANSSPDKFADWLDWAISHSVNNRIYGESIVCVNAWNEWAEGAYLEPDVHFGAAYLNSLSRVVHGVHKADRDSAAEGRPKILLVGHDTLAFGAQKLITNIGETLVCNFGYEVTFLILDSNSHGGSFLTMTSAMSRLGPVIFADLFEGDDVALARHLSEKGYNKAITNTTPTGRVLPALKSAGFSVVSLIHELPNLLKNYNLKEAASLIAAYSDRVIFPADIVQKGFEDFADTPLRTAEVFPQGLYNTSVLDIPPGDRGLRAELGLAPDTKIVLGAGYGDLRKGIDRFLSTGLSLCTAHEDIAFLWVGAPAEEATSWFQPELEAVELGGRVRILGQRDDIARFFAASNAFYLSSREDPFPSVVLEALACGLPVVGHQGCGGCDSLISKHGVLVQQSDPMGAAEAILAVMGRRNRRAANARRTEVTENYVFASYVFGLIQRLTPHTPTVSAVVPNYKYEAYIGERLRTVFDQNFPLREVIVLDDASPDNSLAEIHRAADAAQRVISLHVNDKNSGSPFPQWRKGAELAKGEYVWIGEADDLADPSFVSRLIEQMELAGSVLGFTDSNQVDENGAPLSDTYKPYINQIEPGAFDKSFDMDGPEFLTRYLAVKNVILNVSGVIFRREALIDALDAVGDELYTYSVAGDWRLYAEICAREGSRVSYLSEALNTHRRHRISVTHALKVDKHLNEIKSMHQVICRIVPLNNVTQQAQMQHLDACRQSLEAGL